MTVNRHLRVAKQRHIAQNSLRQPVSNLQIFSLSYSQTRIMSSNKMGPFQLEGVVGRGGMGTVYRARHKDTGEVVAIKSLSAAYSEDEHFRSRFESEIKALIQLDHPNIVRLISHGQEDGNLYFAMELVDGKSLFHLQKEHGPSDWRVVLDVAHDVAAGLRHAHDRGIIHRDLKPGNLLKSSTGEYKITDFGIAKAFGSDHNTNNNVLGTLDFMSPEQAKGQPVTVRSDLFSLGIVLYTMLAGRPPFSANSMEESLRNLTSVPAPSLNVIVPDLPVEIDELIANLIKKKPEERIPTAQVLLHRISKIEEMLKTHSQAATAHGQPKDSNSNSQKTISGSKTELNVKETDGLFEAQVPVTGSDGSKKTVVSSIVPVSPASQPTAAEITKVDSDRGGNSVSKSDYYNRVTEEERRRSLESVSEEPEGSRSGIVWLAIGLLSVLALAGFGIYTAFKPMTADQLYDTIVEKTERPHKVKEEIIEFLERFPDDERFTEIERLDEVASAITYFKTKSLAFASGGESRLTTMEQEFVKTINLAKEDSVSGYSRLRAFLTVHTAQSDDTESAKSCLAAARGYMTKLHIDADNAVAWHEESIKNAFERAEEASHGEKVRIFESIIELYRDARWAEDSVANARERLRILNEN